jgi:hypothetical protein
LGIQVHKTNSVIISSRDVNKFQCLTYCTITHLQYIKCKFSKLKVTKERVQEGCQHRVGRVLSLFSSRWNWDSPNPSPESPPPPPVLGGGAHSLAREGLGESQFRRGDIHCGTLYIYVLCGYQSIGLAFLHNSQCF